jgi:predicted nucleic acid-binding protein
LRGLLDTSVFVASETGRSLGSLPDEPAVSVVTLAELHVGVLRSKDAIIRAQRLRTLGRIERELEAIPIDADVARVFAALVFEAGLAGKHLPVQDTWIAATAVRHGLVLFTQDANFHDIPRVQVRRI